MLLFCIALLQLGLILSPSGDADLTRALAGWAGIPDSPPNGQRCSGRNIFPNGRRCCTPQNPCNEGEGDCDGPCDGGKHDGNAGCKPGLVCGRNNCQKFGSYFDAKDDCCEKPSASTCGKQPPIKSYTNLPSLPPYGQKCKGRNYDDGKRCCTPQNPCDEGEGDCDGAGEGGFNDGNGGCKPGLVCGSNNCLKFGSYYHPSDDCCEKPAGSNGWSNWSNGPCIGGRFTRTRKCFGSSCRSPQHTQTRRC